MCPPTMCPTVTRDQRLDLRCNFVIHDEDLDIFRSAHLSVQEFVETLPQNSTTVSHSLAAECCLAYMMSRAESPTVQRFLADLYLFYDHEDMLPTYPFHLVDFDNHALWYFMKHYNEVGVKKSQGSLQTLSHIFFEDERGASSPLDVWLQQPPDEIIDFNLGIVLHRLRKGAVMIRPENHLQCAFLVACAVGFPEIISQCPGSPLSRDIMAKGPPICYFWRTRRRNC